MTQKLSERNEQIVELVKTHTLQEVADMYGISRQRVDQILNDYGTTAGEYRRLIDSESILPDLGKMSDTNVARKHNIHLTMVRKLRYGHDIEVYRSPIGCDDCATTPYAKGLCRSCYNKRLRRKSLMKL